MNMKWLAVVPMVRFYYQPMSVRQTTVILRKQLGMIDNKWDFVKEKHIKALYFTNTRLRNRFIYWLMIIVREASCLFKFKMFLEKKIKQISIYT